MNKKLQLALCDMQGQLFAKSKDYGYDSQKFIKTFMKSKIAAKLDSKFNHLQWAGKEYIIEEIQEELSNKLVVGECLDKEVLYWCGYLYRFWHFYTGESSKDIYKQAPIKTLIATYASYHTLSIELAIDRLKQSYIKKHSMAFHPGLYLREYLEYENISNKEFAEKLGVTEELISKIIAEKENVTEEIAEKLSKHMGTSKQLWLNLQKGYDEFYN